MFHITENGPKPCSAEHGRCPYEKAGQEHFNNEADAQKFYETKMSQSYGTFNNLKEKRNKPSLEQKTSQPAAKILQQFSQQPIPHKDSFINAYKEKLSVVSKKDQQRILQLRKVLTSK